MMRVSSARFTWGKSNRSFLTELSDLGKDFQFERVYPDACDVGFAMVSAVTGREATFVETGRDMNGDELAGTWFSPTDETIKRWPAMKGVRVLIIND